MCTRKFFKDQKSALALRASALLLFFEKFTRAYLFQIALEIMWFPRQKVTIDEKRNINVKWNNFWRKM